MSLPLSKADQAVARRAAVAAVASVAQRPVSVPASTGADHLPEKYDRYAVQVALDGIVARMNEGTAEARGG